MRLNFLKYDKSGFPCFSSSFHCSDRTLCHDKAISIRKADLKLSNKYLSIVELSSCGPQIRSLNSRQTPEKARPIIGEDLQGMDVTKLDLQ